MLPVVISRRHEWANRLQTALLILILLAICSLTGYLIFGELGFWMAILGALFALLFEPVAAWRLTLQLYRVRPIYPSEDPVLWRIAKRLSERAQLPAVPVLYYAPSSVSNAFAVGSRRQSAIVFTDGLLNQLT